MPGRGGVDLDPGRGGVDLDPGKGGVEGGVDGGVGNGLEDEGSGGVEEHGRGGVVGVIASKSSSSSSGDGAPEGVKYESGRLETGGKIVSEISHHYDL